MPEGYVPSRLYPGKGYRLRDAARDGQLVILRCGLCHRSARYLASDLVTLVDPSGDARDPPFACSRCGTAEHIAVSLRLPELGDYGHLTVRRPAGIRRTQMWRAVKLGDEV